MVRSPFGKFGSKRKSKYLASLRKGLGRMASARAIGVSNELIRLYRKDHPEFIDEENEAEDEATEKVENSLFQAATSGNVVACFGWLYNRCPERWKDKRNIDVKADVHHTGQVQIIEAVQPELNGRAIYADGIDR